MTMRVRRAGPLPLMPLIPPMVHWFYLIVFQHKEGLHVIFLLTRPGGMFSLPIMWEVVLVECLLMILVN